MPSPTPTPTIHVLEKSDYTKQHLVALPHALPLPPLGPSSIRIQTNLISLTTNNLTYARNGHLLGWWDIHLLPPTTPAPFSDTAKHGRISAWGYASIIASTVDSLSAGSEVFGYIPIGTLPEDLEIEVAEGSGQVVCTSPHRRSAMTMYNRYTVTTPGSKADDEEGRGWDALMFPLFGTGFTLNRYVFATNPSLRVDSLGARSPEWSAVDAELAGAVVCVLSASGKTAVGFAHQLRGNRAPETRPRLLIGACSEVSKGFVEKTGLYDDVILYGDVEAARVAVRGTNVFKVVLVDFGAREGVVEAWHTALRPLVEKILFLGVGATSKVMSHEEITVARGKRVGLGMMQVNVSGIRDAAIEMEGQAYVDSLEEAWEGFKREGVIPGVKLRWGDGMEAWQKGWDELGKGKVGAATGLLFRL